MRTSLVARSAALSAVLTFVATSAIAADRSSLNAARAELMRVHIKLTRAAQVDPAVIQARDAARVACAALYQVRQNVLATLHKAPDYGDLRMALWAKQRQILGLYDEIPVRVQSVVGNARDAMDVRAKLGVMENAALEADPTYIDVRNDAKLKLAAQQKALRDALEAIKSDADFVAASARVQQLQRSITGYTNAVASAR